MRAALAKARDGLKTRVSVRWDSMFCDINRGEGESARLGADWSTLLCLTESPPEGKRAVGAGRAKFPFPRVARRRTGDIIRRWPSGGRAQPAGPEC